MPDFPFIKYHPKVFDKEQRAARAQEYYQYMNDRRTVREFSDKTFDIKILEQCILTANTAPSGANKQPWVFCIVSNKEIKKKIREAAEKEEFDNYHIRMSKEWLQDLAPLGTDEHKEFLEKAPYLIVVFRKSYDIIHGEKRKNYYVQESVGLSCGFLIAALHQCGLVCLTHTPSPMNFLQEILQRPENEKPFLLIPVGYPAEYVMVPDIQRKKLDEICVRFD